MKFTVRVDENSRSVSKCCEHDKPKNEKDLAWIMKGLEHCLIQCILQGWPDIEIESLKPLKRKTK